MCVKLQTQHRRTMGLLFGRADEDTIKESGICSYIVYIYTMKKSSYLLCILHIRHGTKQCELSNKKEATLFLMKTNYLWNILIQECK